MIKIEFHIASPDSLLLGFSLCEGEDEVGTFRMFSFGILLFSVDIVRYFEWNEDFMD